MNFNDTACSWCTDIHPGKKFIYIKLNTSKMKFKKNAKNFSDLNKLQFSYLTNLETMIKHFYIFDFWDPVTSQPKLCDLTIMSCKQCRVSCNISMNRKFSTQ